MRSEAIQSISLDTLRQRLRDIELTRAGTVQREVISTGWAAADASLTEGGLLTGATHEFVGLVNHGSCGERGKYGMRDWRPPLLLLAHLARRAASRGAWCVWVGRRMWLYGHAAIRGLGAASRCLWVDAPDAGSRAWAVDAALRAPGVVVIADASGFDSAASRRVQLACAGAGTVGLLARPPHERGEISFASTKWVVGVHPAAGVNSRWMVELVRGARAGDTPRWIIERGRDGGLGSTSSEVRDRPGATRQAS
ncbi:MAG: hypothetical protein GC200_02850 [Tepidisphaera sp.]|nr:hypothetical protein [Tepidisphaera sp.]